MFTRFILTFVGHFSLVGFLSSPTSPSLFYHLMFFFSPLEHHATAETRTAGAETRSAAAEMRTGGAETRTAGVETKTGGAETNTATAETRTTGAETKSLFHPG